MTVNCCTWSSHLYRRVFCLSTFKRNLLHLLSARGHILYSSTLHQSIRKCPLNNGWCSWLRTRLVLWRMSEEVLNAFPADPHIVSCVCRHSEDWTMDLPNALITWLLIHLFA